MNGFGDIAHALFEFLAWLITVAACLMVCIVLPAGIRHHPRRALTSDKTAGTGHRILDCFGSEHRRGCINPRRHLAQGTGTGYERIF